MYIKLGEYKVYLNIFLMNHNVYQMQADKSLVSAFDPEPNPILLQVLLLTITKDQVPDFLCVRIRKGDSVGFIP